MAAHAILKQVQLGEPFNNVGIVGRADGGRRVSLPRAGVGSLGDERCGTAAQPGSQLPGALPSAAGAPADSAQVFPSTGGGKPPPPTPTTLWRAPVSCGGPLPCPVVS